MKALAGKVAMSVMTQTELADTQPVVMEDTTTVIFNQEILEVIVDMSTLRIMEATRIQVMAEWAHHHMEAMGSGNQGNRGLYDRDYQGMGRGDYSNSGTRLGGSNYGSYGDGNRGYYEGRNQGGGSYGSNYGNRNAGGREDRNWFDRASDEVSSWFGDDEAERRRDRDKRMQGQHKGKGPKNYSRSDDRIKEDINDRLSDDPFIDASDIDVTVTNGEVTLSGTVDERSSKRRAEDIAENVSGVKNVENRIRVGNTSNTYGSSTSGTPGSNTESSSSSQSTSGVAGSERTRNKSYVTG